MSAARMGKQCQTYGEFASGGIAALANICITFPINKLIFRQQLSGSIVRFAVAELRSEGLRNAYRGLLPPLLQKGASLSIMFGSYDIFLRRFIELYPPSDTQNPVGFRLSASQTTQEQTKADSERRVSSSSKLGTPAPLMHQLAAGVLAGSVETLLMPFERVQTLMQDKAYHTTLRNTGKFYDHWLFSAMLTFQDNTIVTKQFCKVQKLWKKPIFSTYPLILGKSSDSHSAPVFQQLRKLRFSLGDRKSQFLTKCRITANFVTFWSAFRRFHFLLQLSPTILLPLHLLVE